MNKAQFFEQVTQVAIQYDNDNQWFGFQRGGPPWSRGTWIQYILAAWKLFQNASTNHLQTVLLGDTKIRSDAALLMNFGLVANTNAPQEDADRQLVENLMLRRTGIARGTQHAAVELMGQGSILSAKRWSPLLNDALMLAAILGRQDFLFALNEDEQAVWSQLATAHGVRYIGSGELQRRQAVFGPAVQRTTTARTSEQELWLKFLHAVPRVLWERGTPRVFVRELLGLKFFGYEPVFTMHQLGFRHTDKGTKVPTFPNYLAGLNEVGLHSANRPAIMRALSEFLFNDTTSLNNIGA